MLCLSPGHALIDIKLLFSVNVFKYTPWEFPVPKIRFSQNGSESQKSENWVFRFEYSFQTRLMGRNDISDQLCTQNDYKPNRKCTKKR